jgi:hypothetical protein
MIDMKETVLTEDTMRNISAILETSSIKSLKLLVQEVGVLITSA